MERDLGQKILGKRNRGRERERENSRKNKETRKMAKIGRKTATRKTERDRETAGSCTKTKIGRKSKR
jgi:hypothetical protein